MVDMVLGEDMPGYRARGGPLGVPLAWVSLRSPKEGGGGDVPVEAGAVEAEAIARI